MFGEIITIGDELISGRVVDLNAWYAAGRLTATGLRVSRVTTVGDDQESISKALQKALKDSQFVIITGGLGSTDDDITNEIAASALNRPLCLDEEMYDQIKDYVALRGLKMSRAFEKMAWMPEDAKILCPKENVCGFSLVQDGSASIPPRRPWRGCPFSGMTSRPLFCRSESKRKTEPSDPISLLGDSRSPGRGRRNWSRCWKSTGIFPVRPARWMNWFFSGAISSPAAPCTRRCCPGAFPEDKSKKDIGTQMNTDLLD